MTHLQKLRTARDLRDVAKLLNFTPAGLAYVLYKIPEDGKYSQFEIPKKAGGTRVIQAPIPQLKYLQRCLAQYLLDCVGEIESQDSDRKRISHGFQIGRSIVTNAEAHRRRRYVINIDLADFFGTINFGRVRGFFINDRNFTLPENVATVLAQISCHKNVLPQGAPSSPVISNLIGHILDIGMVGLAKKHGGFYTRYADDITISTNRRSLPGALAKRDRGRRHEWKLGAELRRAVEHAGFSVNDKKTRVQIRGSRQDVTGLVVNEKVNICQEYYRDTRSMCHALFKSGKYHHPGDEETALDDLSVLEGRLAHVYYVKSRRDRSEFINRLSSFGTPRAVKDLYRRFLFYKYCAALDRPIIITEGKTDIIYLKAAMASLNVELPGLFVGGRRVACFLKPSWTNKDVLGLGSGFGGMRQLITNYGRWLSELHWKPLLNPVVLVVDNDDGGSGVLKDANKIAEKEVRSESPDSWFHVTDNLYLVKTPLGAEGTSTSIESCFKRDALECEYNGKRFDEKKKFGDSATISKAVFAERVVVPNIAKLDFSGFVPLLSAISGAIGDYDGRRRREGAERVGEAV